MAADVIRFPRAPQPPPCHCHIECTLYGCNCPIPGHGDDPCGSVLGGAPVVHDPGEVTYDRRQG